MRVLLVSCYELGHQPLHVASAAAFLRAAGHGVSAVDLSVQHLDEADLDVPDLVAIAVPMHTAMRMAVPVARAVRERRGAAVRIVLFGLYAPLCGGSLEAGLVDAVVGGEYEQALVDLASGAPDSRVIVLDRLRFPLPARDLLPPLASYTTLLIDGEARQTGYVEASRGCVHTCRHCPVPAIYGGRMRVWQRDTLVEDVGGLWDAGMRHLTFGDPDFLNAVPHALGVVRAVHQRCPELTFDITTKVEHILEHPEVLAELRRMGLLFIVSAVESTSPGVLDILAKGHTANDVRAALRICRGLGLELRPSLLPFTPWTTLADQIELLDLLADEHLVDSVDPVQLSIRLLVPPGSLLLGREEMRAHLDGYDAAGFSHLWRHPDPAMDRLQADIAALVATDTDAGVAARVTHAGIRRLTAAAAARAGVAWPRAADELPHQVLAPPRLSEPWFCCAEPTTAQLAGAGVALGT
ncbi:MAG: CUAEP/CCAEP-tail radical SAM (seleno)protein [Candidatus Dormibacteria bacterium]